jgi:uncharacterized protein YcfL
MRIFAVVCSGLALSLAGCQSSQNAPTPPDDQQAVMNRGRLYETYENELPNRIDLNSARATIDSQYFKH